MISGVVNAVEIIFQEFDHKEEIWNFKKINTENNNIPSVVENSDIALLNIKSGNINFINSDDGLYKTSNRFADINLTIDSNTLETIYSRDFSDMRDSIRPYINYNDGLLALSAGVNRINTINTINIINIINIYEVISPNEIKVIYKGQQEALYYPVKFGVNNDVFFLNKNIIYRLDLSSKHKEQEYFFKPSSCRRLLYYKFSDDYQVISYTCNDGKINSHSIFLYSRETKILEEVCNNCQEVEHDLSDDGMKLLYVRHDENGSVLNEFYFRTLRNKILYETKNWLVAPLYLN